MFALLLIFLAALFGFGFLHPLWWVLLAVLAYGVVRRRPHRGDGSGPGDYRAYQERQLRQERWDRRYSRQNRARWQNEDRRDSRQDRARRRNEDRRDDGRNRMRRRNEDRRDHDHHGRPL
ncbi:hypothetical protein [Streptomyces sp. NPDC060077]|uniref:hypothetical protein n=1 Tax=Streptomyces sp. NPDC060077 TaxID=3347052 RepID=UPI00365DC64A